METRRRPLTYVVITVVVLALVGWLVVRAVTKQRLLRALGTNDMPVRVDAARKLLDSKKLVDALPAQPVIRRSKAAQALGIIAANESGIDAARSEEAIRILGVILRDQEEAPKQWARRALAKQGRKAVPVLMSALAVGGATKDEAVTALASLGAEATPQIRFLLTDRSAYKGAAAALSQMDDTAIQALIDGCYSIDKKLREQALNNLGAQAVKSSVPAALHNLQKGKNSAIGNAISALGLIGDRSVGDQLIPFLTIKDNRLGAATSLGQLRYAGAVDPLLATLTETEKAYRDAAILALRRIGRPALPALVRDLNSDQVLLRQAAASAFIGSRSASVNSALFAALKDDDPAVRASAALALGWEGNNAAVQPLVVALSDAKWRVVDAAVEGLGNIGAAAVSPLISLLGDPSTGLTVSYQLARSLAAIGAPALDSLIQALSSPNPAVQRWAAVALGQIGDPDALKPLEDLELTATGDLKWVVQEQIRLLSRLDTS